MYYSRLIIYFNTQEYIYNIPDYLYTSTPIVLFQINYILKHPDIYEIFQVNYILQHQVYMQYSRLIIYFNTQVYLCNIPD